MRQIGNNSSSGGHGGNSAGMKVPWWLFRIFKFLAEMNLATEENLKMILGLISMVTTTIRWFIGFSILAMAGFVIYKLNKASIDIPLHLIIGPPVAAVALLCLVLFFAKRNKDTSTDDETEATENVPGNSPTEPEKTRWEKLRDKVKIMWTNGRLLPILVCFALIHLAIYKLAPQFWWDHIWNLWSFGLQVALVLVMSIKPEDPKKPAKHKLSTVAAVLLGITFILHVAGLNMEGSITKTTHWWEEELSKTKSTSSLRTSPVTTRGELKYPRDEHWPDKDVAEQILEGQWDVLAACYRESGLKQSGPDGKPLVNENKNGLGMVTSIDTGICQINSVHDPELKRLGLDKNKLEDNLKFAKILYEKDGLRPWNVEHGQKLVFQVPISEKGSNTFKKPENAYALFNNKEAVHVALNSERWITILEADPGFTDFTPAGTILDYKFRLLPGRTENVWVTVTYTYQ